MRPNVKTVAITPTIIKSWPESDWKNLGVWSIPIYMHQPIISKVIPMITQRTQFAIQSFDFVFIFYYYSTNMDLSIGLVNKL